MGIADFLLQKHADKKEFNSILKHFASIIYDSANSIPGLDDEISELIISAEDSINKVKDMHGNISEKSDFKKGEEIKIRIVNSGTVPLTFSDSSYGLKITGLSGILMYTPVSAQVISHLDPGDEIELSWNQIKNDDNAALEGLYKISTSGTNSAGDKVERSTTVTIWK